MKLANKVALINSGAQGLGKAIALAIANEGAKVVVCDANPKTWRAGNLVEGEVNKADEDNLGRQIN
jgi:NAD(P)-dependent dehydrogenase (short-subunit alcohol dehydrogenase family)